MPFVSYNWSRKRSTAQNFPSTPSATCPEPNAGNTRTLEDLPSSEPSISQPQSRPAVAAVAYGMIESMW